VGISASIKKATTALLFAASLTAASAAGRGDQKFDFSTIDADGNGEITQAEITAFEAAKFAEADTNGDGLLSKEEMLAQVSARFENAPSDRVERRIDRVISHLDENEDGSISLEERQSSERSARMFERLDEDDSGTISAEEAEKAADRRGHGKNKDRKGKHRKGNKKS